MDFIYLCLKLSSPWWVRVRCSFIVWLCFCSERLFRLKTKQELGSVYVSTCGYNAALSTRGVLPAQTGFASSVGCHKAILRWLTFVHGECCQWSSGRDIGHFRCTSVKIALVCLKHSAVFAAQMQPLPSLLVHLS